MLMVVGTVTLSYRASLHCPPCLFTQSLPTTLLARFMHSVRSGHIFHFVLDKLNGAPLGKELLSSDPSLQDA